MKVYNKNRKASHEYHLLETFTAGLVLEGPEVKAICDGRISLKEAFVKVKDGEAWLMQAHISKPETTATWANFDEVRERKLLLTKKEINKLANETQEQGITIIPIQIYKPTDVNKIKLDIAIARGKRDFNKREDLKRKQAEIDVKRALKDY